VLASYVREELPDGEARGMAGGGGGPAEEEVRGGRGGKVGAGAPPAAGGGGRRSGRRWLRERSGRAGLVVDARASLRRRLRRAALLLRLILSLELWSSSSSPTATVDV
jgi:hypothetical protein